MRTRNLTAAAILILPIAGAQADDQAISPNMEEVVVAAPQSPRSLTEEVIAAAKSAPAMPEITFAVNDLELAPPRIDAVLRDETAE